ncbi:MAG: hypothetical protein AAGF45_06075, partial [Pseudomonadota bacterium]
MIRAVLTVMMVLSGGFAAAQDAAVEQGESEPEDAGVARSFDAAQVNAAEVVATLPDTADRLAQDVVAPAYTRLGRAASTLQNAVLRDCTVSTALSRQALARAFDVSVERAASILPVAFGTDDLVNLPDRILTEAESTAFSRNTLEALIVGQAPIP